MEPEEVVPGGDSSSAVAAADGGMRHRNEHDVRASRVATAREAGFDASVPSTKGSGVAAGEIVVEEAPVSDGHGSYRDPKDVFRMTVVF